MASPKDLARVFVVRDFATEGLEQALQNLIRQPGRDYELRAPGVVREGGEILRDVVLPGIMEARRVLVFVDQPNANVGFEAGLAIGLGKPTALVQLGNDPQEWLERPPLINTLVHRLEALSDLYALLEDEAIWQQITLGPLRRNTRGRAPTTQFLCAGGASGAPYRRLQENARPFWQHAPQENFTVRDLPRFFEDVFQMVWVIPEPSEHLSVHQGEGEDGRDGIDNACNAVIAGWFCAQLIAAGESGVVGGQIRDRWDHVKRSLRVLRSAHFRPLRDVELLEQTFEGLGDFDALLQALPVAHLDAATRVRPLWSPGVTDRRPLPQLLREQVSRMQARAVELISGGEFDRALNELRAGDELSASLVDEWSDDPQLKLSRGYLLKTLFQVLVYSGNAELSGHAANQALESFEAAMRQGAEGGLSALELAGAMNGMGNMLQHHGNLDKAIKCYRWATELVPSYAAAWHDLYEAYLRQRSTQDVDVRLLRETFDRMKEHAHGQPGLSSRYIAQRERRLLVLERPMGSEEKMFSCDAPELVQSILEELIRDGGELRVLLRSEDTPLEFTSKLWNTIEAADQALCEKREADARGLLEQILGSAEPTIQAEHEARARAASMMARLEAASHPERARMLAERATESLPQLPRTWYDIGGVWRTLGDPEAAIVAFKRYLVLTQKTADHHGFVDGLTDIAWAFCEHGQNHKAENPLRAAVGIANALGDHERCAQQCLALATYYCSSPYDSHVRMGGGFGQSALNLYKGLSDKRGQANASRVLARVYDQVGDPAAAERLSREALRIYEELEARTEMVEQYRQLGLLLIGRARSTEAEDLYKRARDLCHELGDHAAAQQYKEWLSSELPQLVERDAQVDATRRALRDFDTYLRSSGLAWSGDFPSLRVMDGSPYLGTYNPEWNEIRLGAQAVGDPDIALKEYVYRALHAPLYDSRPEVAQAVARMAAEGAGRALGELLSGVATYLVCSYGNDPGFARQIMQPYGQVALVDLAGEHRMQDIAPGPSSDEGQRARAIQQAGAVWGSALWAIRSAMGPTAADRLVVDSWQTALASTDDDKIVPAFARALVELSPSHGESNRRNLVKRGITIEPGPSNE